jgi:O-antigen ligase
LTFRTRALLGAGAVGVPLLFSPLALQPSLAIALVCALGARALAARSVVYPVAFAGLPAVAIGLAGGRNPLPQGVITEALAAWMAFGIAITVARRDELPRRVLLAPPVVLTVALTVWMLVRLAPSLDPSYGARKLQLFLSGNVLLLVAGALIARRRDRFDLYVVAALVMALLSAVAIARGLLSGAQASVGGRFSLTAEDSPIGLGREAADGILVGVFILLTRQTAAIRVFAIGALPIVTVALVASGSRGPAVGLVIGFITLLILNAGNPAARKRLALVLVGVLGGIVLVTQLVPGQDAGRTLSIFSGRSQGLSSNGRSALWSQAWQLFTHHPLLGVGTGSFGYFQPDELFPHNLALETGSELGLVGVGLVILFLVSCAWVAWRVWRLADGIDRAHASIVLALFVAACVNAMLSSDITANDAVWLTGGLALGLSRRLDMSMPSFARVAGLRRSRRPSASVPGSRDPQHTAPRPTVAPLIVRPAAGAQVGGLVEVEVAAPRGVAPVARMRLEWNGDSVAESDERTFDIGAEGAAAVVKSRWLADLVAVALDTTARPSTRRPWAAPSSFRLWWDASAVPPGGGSLVAVAVDATRREVRSEPVELSVAADAATGPAPEDAARVRAVQRLAELQLNAARAAEAPAEAEQLARLRAELASRAEELDARERAVREEAEQLRTASQNAELARSEERAGLEGRAEELDARERAAREEAEQLRAASEHAELARSEERAGLAGRAEELDAREQAVREQAEQLHAERESDERGRELAEEAAKVQPELVLVAPAGYVGGTVELEVHATHVDGPVTVELGEGAEWIEAPGGPSLETAALADGPARLRARAGSVVSAPVIVIVDNEPPTVRITSPNDGDEITGRVVPAVDTHDSASPVGAPLLQRSQDGIAWRPLVDGAWDTTRDDDGDWLLRASAPDAAHNVGRSEIVRVVVRNVRPVLVPDPEPEPEPMPEPEPEPELEPRPSAPLPPLTGRPTLFELEAHAAVEPDRDRRESMGALLFVLRDYADVDGLLPANFDGLIAEEFGL